MLSTLNPSETLEFVVVIIGVILVLKKIADMNEYHITRVAVLTVILSVGVILLINGLAVTYGGFGPHSCVIEFDGPVDHY
jgi:uncharacterized membrane protein